MAIVIGGSDEITHVSPPWSRPSSAEDSWPKIAIWKECDEQSPDPFLQESDLTLQKKGKPCAEPGRYHLS